MPRILKTRPVPACDKHPQTSPSRSIPRAWRCLQIQIDSLLFWTSTSTWFYTVRDVGGLLRSITYRTVKDETDQILHVRLYDEDPLDLRLRKITSLCSAYNPGSSGKHSSTRAWDDKEISITFMAFGRRAYPERLTFISFIASDWAVEGSEPSSSAVLRFELATFRSVVQRLTH